MKLKDRKKSNPYGKRGALFTKSKKNTTPDTHKKESAVKKSTRRKKKTDNG